MSCLYIGMLGVKKRKGRNKKVAKKTRRCNMFESWNERIKKMTVIDIGLVKLSVFFATIVIVKIFPELLNNSYPILIMFMIAFGAKPLYKFWIKKS